MSITIEGNENDLHQQYETVYNKDTNLVKTSNDVPTPIACVEEMMDTIPDAFLKDGSKKWLDPCCGCGNFFVVACKRLMQYHSLEHILTNMLYFNDINADRIAVVREVFCESTYALHITENDFLTYNPDITFDIILANPPYAKLLPNGKRASKNHNLIGVFIKQSLKLLNPNGYLLYITPDNWMSFADRNTLITELTSKQIVHLNIHTAKKYFKKIGSSFTWYLIENCPAYKNITVEGIWKGNNYTDSVESMSRKYIPLCYTQMVQNILRKTIDCETVPKIKVETSSYLHKYTKREFIRAEKDDEFKYKLWHTPKQIVWANRPHKYQEGWKVFISTTSSYSTIVDNCGMTQSIVFVRCDSKDDADQLAELLRHPLYIFINNICRWGNFNNIRILQSFPRYDSYDSVYEQSGLTDEEKKYMVENSIK